MTTDKTREEKILLSNKQARYLELYLGLEKKLGKAPSLREVGKAMGLKHVRGSEQYLSSLVKKGILQRTRGVKYEVKLTDVIREHIEKEVQKALEKIKAFKKELEEYNAEYYEGDEWDRFLDKLAQREEGK